MSKYKNLQYAGQRKTFNDVVYTPIEIVKEIIEWVNPKGTILEPFKGNGSFYNELIKTGNKVSWTEIEKGKDFNDYKQHVDYIITNPPYSNFTHWLEKMFSVSDNVIILIPHMKVYSSNKRLNMIEEYGTFEYLRIKDIKEWSINFPLAAYWFKKKTKEIEEKENNE